MTSDAPRAVVAGDRDRDLGCPPTPSPTPPKPVAVDRAGIGRGGPLERAPSAPYDRGSSGRRVGPARSSRAARAARRGARRSATDRNAAALADDEASPRAGPRRASRDRRRSGPSADDGREVGPAAETLAIASAAGRRRSVVRRDRGAAAPSDRGCDGRAGRAVGRVLGGGEEPLEVPEPVAAVAARIDPVVAQPAGIAPRPDGVRVDAQQAGGLRHREGGIDGTGGKRARHGSLMEEMSSRRPQPTNLTVLANRTKVLPDVFDAEYRPCGYPSAMPPTGSNPPSPPDLRAVCDAFGLGRPRVLRRSRHAACSAGSGDSRRRAAPGPSRSCFTSTRNPRAPRLQPTSRSRRRRSRPASRCRARSSLARAAS